jgi:hypothetical protein
MTHNQCVTLSGLQQAREHGNSGALPGPIRSQKAEDLASRDLEAYALHGVNIAETLI